MLAEIESGRAHQIADVFDEQQIEPREGQLVQRPMYEVRIEMTGGPRRDLHRLLRHGRECGPHHCRFRDRPR